MWFNNGLNWFDRKRLPRFPVQYGALDWVLIRKDLLLERRTASCLFSTLKEKKCWSIFSHWNPKEVSRTLVPVRWIAWLIDLCYARYSIRLTACLIDWLMYDYQLAFVKSLLDWLIDWLSYLRRPTIHWRQPPSVHIFSNFQAEFFHSHGIPRSHIWFHRDVAAFGCGIWRSSCSNWKCAHR